MENNSNTAKQAVQKEETRGSKPRKPNNIHNVPVGSRLDFFKWWCVFLRPFINLTDRESDVISSFLNQRWQLSQTVQDPMILDTLLMSENIKKKVLEECNITLQHFYVVMSTLRRKKVIEGNSINPKLIPNVRADDNGVFQLLILFKDSNKHQ